MRRRTLDEMITYFNQQLSEMDIDRKYKMQLLGMITAIGFEAQKHKWIPCSERLPELKKWVLVSSGDCVVSDCLIVSARGGNKIWYECGTIDIENDAWMPLPAPYKEDTDGK